MRKYVFIALFTYTFIPLAVSAHPGNTASDGCHYCRTNCDKWGVAWNERHCHASKGVPQPTEPIRSIRGEVRGTAVPAPEYQTYIPKASIPVSEPAKALKEIKTQVQKKTSAPVNNQVVGTSTSSKDIVPISQPKPQQKKSFWARFFGR
ncbi:MAG: hypothetical protein Q7R69_01805 [bacterium]|nr:hypothetical protein [bacterium]